MRIGIPKERKPQEYRVALTPDLVAGLVRAGHSVRVEVGAGTGSGYPDDLYRAAGASLADGPDLVWAEADLLVKVKEPLPEEFSQFREGLLLFAFLHLAARPDLAEALRRRRVSAVAFETVEEDEGVLPILVPMSEIAGCLAPQMGSIALQRVGGGKGILLGGAGDVPPGKMVVLGAGTVGMHASRIGRGLGAHVLVLDRDPERLAKLRSRMRGGIEAAVSSAEAVARAAREADLLIGAIHSAGARTPKILTRSMVASMEPGSVLVDVAIDQGGCAETSRPTTHERPTYIEEGVVHLCVANLPSAVARTSTRALGAAIIPYVHRLAAGGVDAALSQPALRRGLNIHCGNVVHPAVATSLGVPVTPL